MFEKIIFGIPRNIDSVFSDFQPIFQTHEIKENIKTSINIEILKNRVVFEDNLSRWELITGKKAPKMGLWLEENKMPTKYFPQAFWFEKNWKTASGQSVYFKFRIVKIKNIFGMIS